MQNLDHDTLKTPTTGQRLRSIAASGRIYFWPSGSLWLGRGQGRTEWHNHHAHQLALALEGSFRFRSDASSAWTEFQAAIVPSHCPHEFEIDGATMAHLFVEPESMQGRALSRLFDADEIAALPQPLAREATNRLRSAYLAKAEPAVMKTTASALVAMLSDTAKATREADARMLRALSYIRSNLHSAVTLADAARAAALSPSRFRHLFAIETGTTFRAYLLWLRINVAIESAMAGATWTEAAHDAGFADSAHLSRTHRRMFGIEPTAIRPD